MTLASVGSFIGPAIGAISGLAGGGSGAGTGGAPANLYQYQNLDKADTAAFNNNAQYFGSTPWDTQGIGSDALAALNNLYADPNSAAYTAGATSAGQTLNQFANPASTAATGLYDTAAAGLGGSSDLLATLKANPGYAQASAGATGAGNALNYTGLNALGNSVALNSTQPNLALNAQQLNASQNNPYNAQAMDAAQRGGDILQTQAMRDLAAGNALTPAAMAQSQTLNSGANTILNTAFDPQNALYGQQVQKLTDQTQAELAQSGLGTSAAGAGILGQNLNDFSIAWQNAQLGRQESGLGAAQSATGQALSGQEGAATTAQGIGGAAGLQYANGGALPMNLYNQQQGVNTSALGSYLNNIGSIGSNAAGANSLGATGAGQIATGAALPYNLAQSNLAGQVANYGAIGAGAGQYGNLAGQGQGQATNAANMQYQGGYVPYQASQTVGGNQLNALGQYGNLYNTYTQPIQQGISNNLKYLGQGSSAQASNVGLNQKSYVQGQGAYAGLGAFGQQVGNAIFGNGTTNNSGYTGSYGSYGASNPAFTATGGTNASGTFANAGTLPIYPTSGF